MIHFISDTHFYHRRIAELCPSRPEDWMDILVANWKERVKEQDIVVHLGDVGFGPKLALVDLFRGLPGKRVLVRGNHDKGTSRFLEMGFWAVLDPPEDFDFEDVDMGVVSIVSVVDETDFFGDRYSDHVIYVSHVPVRVPIPERDPWGLYLYGHEHDRFGPDPYCPYPWGRNMGVEINDLRPWSLKELLELDRA